MQIRKCEKGKRGKERWEEKKKKKRKNIESKKKKINDCFLKINYHSLTKQSE